MSMKDRTCHSPSSKSSSTLPTLLQHPSSATVILGIAQLRPVGQVHCSPLSALPPTRETRPNIPCGESTRKEANETGPKRAFFRLLFARPSGKRALWTQQRLDFGSQNLNSLVARLYLKIKRIRDTPDRRSRVAREPVC